MLIPLVVTVVAFVAPFISADGSRLGHGMRMDHGVILDDEATDLGSHVDGRGVPRCPTCPHFLPTPSHVTASVGIMTNLSCGVRNLDNSRVSWIRRSDLHVLTTGSTTYTSDDRFEARHTEGSPYWVLVLRRPVTRDSGIYECQVSTQPKMYRRFTLTVREPRAEISGASEVFMRAGSDINVTCVVIGAPRGTPIQWYHSLPLPPGTVGENVQLVSEGGRGGVQLVTDKHSGTSWLLVTSATWRDAGTYSCAPHSAHPASITVHVLDQDAPAAMQRDELSSSSPSTYPSSTATLISLVSSPLLLGGCGYGSCKASRVAAAAATAVVAACVDLLRSLARGAEDYLPKPRSSCPRTLPHPQLYLRTTTSPVSTPALATAHNTSTVVLFTITDIMSTENMVKTDVTSTGNMIKTDLASTGNITKTDITSTGNMAKTDITSTGNTVKAEVTSTGNIVKTDITSTMGIATASDIFTSAIMTTTTDSSTTDSNTIPDATTETDITIKTGNINLTDSNTKAGNTTTAGINSSSDVTTACTNSVADTSTTAAVTGAAYGLTGWHDVFEDPRETRLAEAQPSAQPGCGG